MPGIPGRKHGSIVHKAMEFTLWAASQPHVPSTLAIQGRLQIGKAQARHWRGLYLSCLPVQPRETPSPAATGTPSNLDSRTLK